MRNLRSELGRLPLPSDFDASKAEVSYQDGVITVIVPKTKAIPPTRLSVP